MVLSGGPVTASVLSCCFVELNPYKLLQGTYMAADRRHTALLQSGHKKLALALLLGLAGAAQAQSLQELYDAARAYDATYLAARAQADSVQFNVAQVDALARPKLGLGLGSTHQASDLPGALPRYTTTTSTLGLNGSYALYNRANALAIEQAQRNLGLAQADLESAEQDLIVRVAQAYFDVLGARDSLSTSQANRKAIAEQLASAKRNFEVGTATITDTREAQARFDLATAQELAADNDLRVKQVALDQLVGRVGVDPKPLAQPVALPALPSNEVETWVAQAAEHPVIRKARLGLEVAQLELRKSRAAEGVTVDMTGSLGRQNVSSNNTQIQASGTTTSASIGVSVNYPLYTGGATSNRIKETLRLEEKSRNDLDYAQRSVTQGTRQAFFGVQSLVAQVRAYEAAESSTKLALEATELGYKVGVRVNLDVLNAQTQLYSTQRDLAQARYNVPLNSLKLRQASGRLLPEDVTAINQLLAK